jgi:hypothetical protein
MKLGQLDLLTKRVRKAPLASERATHIAVADLLRASLSKGWWASHIPSGELRTEATGKLLKRMYTQPGMADFVLLGPGCVCWLELKRPPNKPTEAQVAFGKAAILALSRYEVAYSYADAERILKAWGAVRIST